jgi:hypothetical protein
MHVLCMFIMYHVHTHMCIIVYSYAYMPDELSMRCARLTITISKVKILDAQAGRDEADLERARLEKLLSDSAGHIQDVNRIRRENDAELERISRQKDSELERISSRLREKEAEVARAHDDMHAAIHELENAKQDLEDAKKIAEERERKSRKERDRERQKLEEQTKNVAYLEQVENLFFSKIL